MKTASLELLEKTQLPPAQARAILEVMESELAFREGALASKADLRDGLHGLELKIEGLRGELQGLRGEFQVLRGDARADIQSLRGELIREIKSVSVDNLRWNFAFWVAQLAAIAGILKLLK